MNKGIFTYLRSYSANPQRINRLIVSAFLNSFNIKETSNSLINQYLIKSHDDDSGKLSEFLAIHHFTKIEELIEIFEFVISPEEKVVTGAVYTPKNIRSYIVGKCLEDVNGFENFKICDPACGCGGFLLTVSQRLIDLSDLTYEDIFRNNIYGLDIEEFSIERSKILLSLAAILDGEDKDFEFNFFRGNALNFIWEDIIENFTGFTVVIGNPPYVCSRNIDNESKKLLENWSVCSTGHPDLYIPFFQIGISLLQEGGKLGFITMNTFYKSVNGRALRNYFQDLHLNFDIIDFGAVQIFNSKSTYTCICLIENSTSENLNYVRIEDYNDFLADNFILRPIFYNSLDAEHGWNLQAQDLIHHIENTGKPLGVKFKSRNGIATLRNTIYIFDPIRKDKNFYYLNSEGTEYRIERSACVDVVNPNKLIKLNSIDTIRKKIILPYSVRENKINIIKENKFATSYPFTHEYLSSKKDVLATRDKGKGKKYDVWYQFGRNQSLEPYSYKLFFPHISPHIPNYVINDEPDLLFVNGIAIVSDNLTELEYLRKIMSSRLFWFYITNSSKPYGSGYFSLSRNYIKNFGIYDFDDQQIKFLIETEDQQIINKFLEELYGINLETVAQPIPVASADAQH